MSAALLSAAPAGAVTIYAVYDSSITNLSNAAQVEGAISTAVTAINSLYSNLGTIPVLFMYNSGLGGGGETDSDTVTVSYASYLAALESDSAANASNTVLATAVANLPGSITQTMTVTAPFANLILGQSLDLCFNASGTYVPGCGQTYAAVVTVSASSYTSSPGYNPTAVTVVEHELDEVLGGGGTGTTLTDTTTGPPTSYGPTDLYRYASTTSTCAGLTTTRSYTSSTSAVACYSIDGGQTNLDGIQFNQTGGGSDYGDFTLPNPSIQDAYVPGPVLVYSASSPEFAMMESIGYDSSIPEPCTWGMGMAGLGAMLYASRRRLSARG